jgi:exonuclease III
MAFSFRFFVLLYILGIGFASPKACAQNKQNMSVLFYNCENFMDTIDDPLTLDDEFTPASNHHWDTPKYFRKIKFLAKALIASSGWQFPDLIGLAEVENREVVTQLFRNVAFRGLGYQIVHFPSPDSRGIDLAFAYRPEAFELIKTKPIAVDLGGERTTRDILYVKGVCYESDTLHLFINHWPSRWGGQLNSEQRRLTAARTLHQWVDSLNSIGANILIMGDFNDTPSDESIVSVLNASTRSSNSDLVNLMSEGNWGGIGSHYYQGEWAFLDQFILSRTMLVPGASLSVLSTDVGNSDFLFEDTSDGVVPFRTYSGPKYLGGFSDHLPIHLVLQVLSVLQK